MRVAVDLSGALAGPSGLRFYIEELLAGLARQGGGHEFLLYAAFWSGRGRLDALRLPKAANFAPAFRRFPQRLLLPAEELLGLKLQESWARGSGADLFHGPANVLPPLARLPGVVTLHHVGGISESAGAWDRFYLERLTRRSCERARAVIAVSEFTRGEARKAWGLEAGRVVTVHEGGPLARFRPAASGAPRPRPWPYFLHVGSLMEHKMVPTLVRAFALRRARLPASEERLVLVGRPGRDSARVAAAIADGKVGDRVELAPAASGDEILALYQGAAAAVVPSRLEGFGFPVLEAMACGTPVVSSTAGALPEVAGEAALFFEAGDAEELSGALDRAVEPATAAGLRAKGLERVRAFSWDEAARRTLAVYSSAAGAP